MLEVRKLSKGYRGLTAVDSLSFTVNSGELIALLGPNGAGKSTTLTCIAGYQKPDSGTVLWNDRVLGSDRSRYIALVPETPEVFPLLTIWEHMVFVARGLDLPPGWEPDAEALLKRFQILQQRDKLGEALSKGMRQKLLVACAALAGTEVMLLDEPMVGLDPHAQRELRQMLLELKSAGRALMISSHLISYLEGLADRAVIIKSGRLVAEGSVRCSHAGLEGPRPSFSRTWPCASPRSRVVRRVAWSAPSRPSHCSMAIAAPPEPTWPPSKMSSCA